MKKIFFSSCFLLLSSYLFSQVDMGLPTATSKGGAANGILYDWECVGVNPANLGWEKNHRFSISAGIVGISAQSKALDYGQLKLAITHPNDTFSQANKKAFAELFTDKDGLNLQSNINWLAFSVAIPKFGGIAMNLRDRTFGHIHLNQNAADILFMGMNAPIFHDANFWAQSDSIPKKLSHVFDGSNASYMHYREVNFSYGTKLFGFGGTKDSSKVSIYGGVGFKYLWGLGDFEMRADNGKFTGHSTFTTKYGINYDSIPNFTPEATSGLFSSVGTGSAWDLGMGIGIGKVKITASVIDIGKITWNKNILVADDTQLDTIHYNGINSWDLSQQSNQIFNDKGVLKFKPGKSYTTTLPSRFRIGIGYQVTRRIILGADMVAPVSENKANLEQSFFAAGTEMELASNFKISFGFAGNSTYGFSLPMGVVLGHFFKIMEVSIATNDILTYLSHGSNPNISLSLSLFRFSIDKKKKK